MNAALTAGFRAATGSFAEKLRTYSTLLLDILTGDAVISVNRIAMSQTCLDSAKFGNAVLANWQEQVRAPFLKLLSEGRGAGEFEIEDVDDAFDTLVGLLIGDRQRRLLLGENARPSSADMTRIADRAVDRFMELFGA